MKQIEISNKWKEAKKAGNESLVDAYAALGEAQAGLRSTKRRLVASTIDTIMRLERLVKITADTVEETNNQSLLYNEIMIFEGLGNEIEKLTCETALQLKMFGVIQALVEIIEKTENKPRGSD